MLDVLYDMKMTRHERATNIGVYPYKTGMKTKSFIFLLLLTLTLFSCSDCDCKVSHGEPNFSLKMSYKLKRSGFSLFGNDTVSLRYILTLHPNSDAKKEFIGERKIDKNGDRYILWHYGSTGREVDVETRNSLKLCLKLHNWYGRTEMREMISDGVMMLDTSPQRVELLKDE